MLSNQMGRPDANYPHVVEFLIAPILKEKDGIKSLGRPRTIDLWKAYKYASGSGESALLQIHMDAMDKAKFTAIFTSDRKANSSFAPRRH